MSMNQAYVLFRNTGGKNEIREFYKNVKLVEK
jgi:hypothetical protein